MAATATKQAAAPESDRHLYGEVNDKADLERIFADIRSEVNGAKDRPALTELYRRAGYLITLTHAPSWEEKFGGESGDLRRAAQEEFARTAKAINRRAQAVNTDADYDEKWGR